MRYTRFGQTDLEVSRVCFGTWQFGGDWGSNEERDLVDAMRRALDLGINFFDTAQAYGFGTSEQIVGKALEPEIKSSREEVVLATKGGLKIEGDQMLRDSSPEWLRQGEKRGTLPPASRDRNGYRFYTPEDIERLRNRRRSEPGFPS